MITWTVGSSGLIGQAIASQCARVLPGTRFQPGPIPWNDPPAARSDLAAHARTFAEQAHHQPWAIIWAAGAATVASSMDECLLELESLTALVEAVRAHKPGHHGVFFLGSSAGGVYSGSANPPFDEHTLPRPVNSYGKVKLLQEEAAAQGLEGVCALVIGRFSNIYGPGQNLDKLQGVISRLALAAATRQPLNIFVSLDTLRDYLYVGDAAAQAVALISGALSKTHESSAHPARVIASGEPVSLSHVIRTMEAVTKKRVPLALGSHPSSVGQVHDLRLVPSVRDDARAALPSPTHLEVGSRLVYDDILNRLQWPTRPPGRRSA